MTSKHGRPAHCAALSAVSAENHSSSRVDLPVASDDALDALRNACNSPVTGHNAGELQNDHFAINLDLERLGLFDAVRTSGCLSTEEDKRKDERTPLRAELSKLVVHGNAWPH